MNSQTSFVVFAGWICASVGCGSALSSGGSAVEVLQSQSNQAGIQLIGSAMCSLRDHSRDACEADLRNQAAAAGGTHIFFREDTIRHGKDDVEPVLYGGVYKPGADKPTPDWVNAGHSFRQTSAGEPVLCAVGTMTMEQRTPLSSSVRDSARRRARKEIAAFFGVTAERTGTKLTTEVVATLHGVADAEYFFAADRRGTAGYQLVCVNLAELKEYFNRDASYRIFTDLSRDENLTILTNVYDHVARKSADSK